MDAQERYKIRQLLRKSRIVSGKKYMPKKERQQIIDGIIALQKLSIKINAEII